MPAIAAGPTKESKPAAKEASAAEAATQPRLEFKPLAGLRAFVSDPHRPASPEAERVWRAVIDGLGNQVAETYSRDLLAGGLYAVVRDRCFLVLHAALLLACPDDGNVQTLTPWDTGGNIEVGELRETGDGWTWALVAFANFRGGIWTQSWLALMISPATAKLRVFSEALVTAQSEPAESRDTLCAPDEEQDEPHLLVATRVLGHRIERDARGADSATFELRQQDCTTMQVRRLNERYSFLHGEVLRLRRIEESQ